MQNGKSLRRAGLSTGSVPDWDRLLLGDPEETLGALRAWLGPERSPDPAIEHGYWEVLADRCTTRELAEAILQRLDLDGERLLDVGSDDLLRLRERLESAAREGLDHLDLAPEERERIGWHPFLLAEVAFEGQGLLPPAAALYAVAHEGRAGDDAFSRYEGLLLSFKLGNALLLLDEMPEPRRRCIGFVRRVAERADEMRESSGTPREALRAKAQEIRIWLGHRLEELGDLEAAAESFRVAVGYAGTPDDRVVCAARAASALAACGRIDEARELLFSVRDVLESVEDEMVRDLWVAILWSLEEERG
jgi:hypothetical protein